MKTNRLLILLFLIFSCFYGQAQVQTQKTLTGLWTGIMSNDSTTVRKDQSFEIALTEYRGKVYGYSRSTFIVNDTLYYIMKRVKGTINGDVCEVKDDEILSYNFRGKIDKGIKVTTTFRMNKNDSTWSLNGNWTTNQNKKYYAITGKVDLKDEPDMEKAKIFPHLEELNLAKDVPFYVEAKKEAEIKTAAAVAKNNTPPVRIQETVVKRETLQQKPKEPATIVSITKPQIPQVTTTRNEENKPAETLGVKNEPKRTETNTVAKSHPKEEENLVVTKPELKTMEPAIVNNQESKPVSIAKAEEKKPQVKQQPVESIVQENSKKQEPITRTEEKKPVEVVVKEVKKESPPAIAIAEPKKTEPVVVPTAAALVKERKMAPPQEVVFVSDSLQLALYDNGEVDGDTVSVLMNGELIMAKQGLKVSAIRKTIYIQPGENEFNMVLYAENLGKYPPNTGLLVVYDGEERYQVRFSADLQQNASIIFRRKK